MEQDAALFSVLFNMSKILKQSVSFCLSPAVCVVSDSEPCANVSGTKSAQFAKSNLITMEVIHLWQITSKQNTLLKPSLQGFANLH